MLEYRIRRNRIKDKDVEWFRFESGCVVCVFKYFK